MKKVLFLLFLTLPFIFNSCITDDDPIVGSSSLNGTTWVYYGDEEGLESELSITFSEETYTFYGYDMVDGEKDEYFGSGSYTYDPPIVTFIEDEDTLTATVSGNKMTTEEEYPMVFVKK
ncbi:hypothetical protein [Parabacteroides sp. PF5-9]|uniref:hypothetical protein n=1 Tax=Parabacteroides sp. PF5-9 TaxID=1742404 RepID=UPI002475A002|nr:hypothetical protein [Parabacteroides sp. PF5-9]MDH6358986.1 hypothetical protein [Parabacteroides sp. PF5-9]